MRDVDEAVGVSDASRPALHLGSVDLDPAAAVATDEVVVMLSRAAAPESRLSVVTPQGIDIAGFSKRPQLVVDGAEGDVLAAGLELGVEVLSRAKTIGGVEDRRKSPLLPG